MIMLSDTEALVFDTDDLYEAVSSNNGVDHVYLGGDITLEYPVSIYPGKQSLIIDGTHEGVTYTLTDMYSDQPTDTLRIGTISSIALTLQNMNITGRNFYGIPYISGVGTSNVIVTYRDITYTGPQLAYNPIGTTRFENADITIVPSPLSQAEEVGEVNRVEFSGTDNIIRHNSTSDGVFYFRGPLFGTSAFTMLENSKLTLTTTNYFLFNLGFPTAVDIRSGASIDITSQYGFCYTSSHTVTSFTVGSGAAFKFVQITGSGSDSLYLSGQLRVNPGGNFYMQGDYSDSTALVNFTSTASGTFHIDNPKSFVLYKKDSSPVAVSGSSAGDYHIGGEQLNHWTAAEDFPAAGTFEDIPWRKWNNDDWASFYVTGLIASGGNTATSHELYGTQHSMNDFQFLTARVISAGSVLLVPDPVIDDGRPITGLADPGAALKISFTVEGVPYNFENITAGSDGRFTLDHEILIPTGTVITIGANTPFLIKYIDVTAVPIGEIDITSAPVRIEFTTPPLSTNPILLGRVVPGAEVVVTDTRAYPTSWRLYASISGPLQSANGEVLENAAVFRDTDYILHDLSETPIAVYTGGPGSENVSWDIDKGMLLRITQSIRSGAEYSTRLSWSLEIIEG